MNVFELFGRIVIDNQSANKGLDATAKKATQAQTTISRAFTNMAQSSGKNLAQIAQESGKTTAQLRSDIMRAAQKYKAEGLTMSAAMKKAYSDIGYESSTTTRSVSKDADVIQGKMATTAKSMQTNMVSAFEKIEKKAIQIGKTVAKGMAMITAAGTAAVGALMKAAVTTYADFEQLEGGVKTLFGEEDAKKVLAFANNAFQTLGLSANDYMSTVTGFSAKLIKDLGGDTAAAAEMANMAVSDMTDNANKMGTDISLIQNAYQGFAKGNFTMLDNLKLGYGGTAEEMARLINDSGVMGDTFVATAENLDQISFAKMIEALHVVQGEMGLTGATAEEVETTITGSFNAWKAAGSNLLTAIASGDQKSMAEATEAFTARTAILLENLKPVVKNVIASIGTLLTELWPDISAQALDFGAEIIAQVINGITGSGITSEDVKAAINKIFDIGGTALDNTLSFVKDALAWINEHKAETIAAISAIALAFLAFKLYTDPIGTAIDLIVVGIAALIVCWEDVKAAIDIAITAIDDFFTKTIPEAWTSMVQTVADWWTGTAAPAIDSAATSIANFFGIKVPEGWSITDTIAEGWQGIIDTIAAAMDAVREFLGLADNPGEAQTEYVAHAKANAEQTIHSKYAGKYAHWTWDQRSAAEDYAWARAMGHDGVDELSALNNVGLSDEAVIQLQADVSDALASGEFTADNIYLMFEPGAQEDLQAQLNAMPLVAKVQAALSLGTSFAAGMLPGLKTDGSHASGLRFVPYDNYLANLHMGETVLPRHEADEWRRGYGGMDTSRLETAVNSLISLTQQLVANTAGGQNIVLDTGIMVGQLAPRMDAHLGTLTARKERRG